MKSNNVLKVYAIIVTFIALSLYIDNRNLNYQLDEEVTIKYEYSAIIDSLLTESQTILYNEIEGQKP